MVSSRTDIVLWHRDNATNKIRSGFVLNSETHGLHI